jgi:hypothetical protein
MRCYLICNACVRRFDVLDLIESLREMLDQLEAKVLAS